MKYSTVQKIPVFFKTFTYSYKEISKDIVLNLKRREDEVREIKEKSKNPKGLRVIKQNLAHTLGKEATESWNGVVTSSDIV